MTFSERVGNQIIAIMETNKISQSDLAAEMGVTRPAICIKLRNPGNISLKMVDKLLEAIEQILAKRLPPLPVEISPELGK